MIRIPVLMTAAALAAAAALPVTPAAARDNLGGGFISLLFGGGDGAAPATYSAPAGSPARAGTAVYAPPDGEAPRAGVPRNWVRPPDRIARADNPAEPARQSHYVPEMYQRQEVAYDGPYAAGTIVIDTAHRFLYLVQPGGKALRYGVGVGREGFAWHGTETIAAKREWPGWTPPADMLKRQPELPRHMDGGPNNPLGARAMYLGNTLYRIHGSNQPWTIGHAVSSGCIRMTNQNVIDLYNRVKVGTKVVVLKG
jgi:lipoprotein-anchoring transpeptidase ErfK/SrfK